MIVIYFSKDDDCWIGHCLRTDQVGLGSDPLEALRDVRLSISQIEFMARQDSTIRLLREPSADIVALQDIALPLQANLSLANLDRTVCFRVDK